MRSAHSRCHNPKPAPGKRQNLSSRCRKVQAARFSFCRALYLRILAAARALDRVTPLRSGMVSRSAYAIRSAASWS
jgi:hypothetical protein